MLAETLVSLSPKKISVDLDSDVGLILVTTLGKSQEPAKFKLQTWFWSHSNVYIKVNLTVFCDTFKETTSDMSIIFLYSLNQLKKTIWDHRVSFQLEIVTVKPLISCLGHHCNLLVNKKGKMRRTLSKST